MTQPLTDHQLDEIETRANTASPGPWTVSEDYSDILNPDGDQLASYWNPTAETRNGEFIAHALVAEVRRLRARLDTMHSETMREAANLVLKTTAPLDWDADAISCWNTALNIAEHNLRRHVATVLPPRRTLTPGEYSAAWHAVEGAAGEEGADPATVLRAVLDRLGIDAPV